ncbi:MAG: SusC/RagA family TonB-linked outer membrane protein [Gemmatimonadaceae bacterium]
MATAFAILLLPAALAAQAGGTVAGQVLDAASQAPVEGVQVMIVGTQRGTTTNAQGRYSIAGVPAGVQQVRARRVGYGASTQAVTVVGGQTSTVNFTLTQAATQLQEVVVNAVTGQAQRREEIGTNTGNISVADLPKGPINNMAEVLQGRVAGVNLQSAAGSVGSSQRIRIRGANSLSLSNEPLLYVDGVLVSNGKGGISLGGQDYSRLNDINPEEIENIEILKGPAASAIYGSAAANGVVLISTKRGRSGAAKWGAYVEGSQSKDENTYPLNYAALQVFTPGQPFYDIPNGGILRTRQIFGARAPYNICPNYQAAAGSCTQDTVLSFNQFRDPRTSPYQTGTRAKFGVNVSGGSDALTYYVSADKERADGVLRPNSLDQTSLRANMNARIGEKANLSVSTAYVNALTNRISNDNSVFSPLINAFLGPAQYLPGMESDTVSSPGQRVGSYFGYNTADQRKVQADQTVDRVILGANANYTPLSWLRLNGNTGLDFYGRYDARTINPADRLPLALSYRLGNHYANRSLSHLWTANGSATGTFSILDNLVSNTTAGASFQRNLFEGNDCYGIGIPAGTKSCSATTSQFAVSETHTDERTVGFFAREELAFADRLFLAGSIRADNNSGLSRDISGLSYFPSVNASWVVSREPFFPALDWVNQLRLRAAYGKAGQRPGFGDAETFFVSAVTQVAGQESPALVLSRTGNPALKVETTTEVEGGFDVGLFNDRVTAEYTLYNRRSVNALISRNLAPSAGLTGSVFQNLGSIKNWGNEFGLNVLAVDRSNVRFNAHLTATTLQNRIENLGEGIAPIQFNRGAQAHRQDFPTGAFFALPVKYKDADGNGLLSRAEVSVDSSKFLVVRNATTGKMDTLSTSYVGPVLPTNTQGISGELTLFNTITISTLFERRGGNRQLNYTEYFRCRQQGGTAYFSQCSALSNPNATLQEQAAYLGAQFLGATPYGYIEDASFVKWRELSVRLQLPQRWASASRLLSGAAISLSGRNLATWTKYTGLDPEINESGGGSNFTQGEFNTQPPVRTFSVRFDFQP